MPSLTPEQVNDTVGAYVKAFEAADKEGWIALFTDDAEQIDPYPAPANVGRAGLAQFWDNVYAMASDYRFDVRQVTVAGDRAAVTFTLSMKTGDMRVEFDGVDLFELADDGRIRRLTAYWDPTQVRPS
ncbi:MAG TPA: nuclear transport factor 2 family protein [Acidimicrobiales bacterium]|jgi:steroid delta-isomerase|nr:nuclear transport factor 2 family protein [Acidimicrobiales bacterium]